MNSSKNLLLLQCIYFFHNWNFIKLFNWREKSITFTYLEDENINQNEKTNSNLGETKYYNVSKESENCTLDHITCTDNAAKSNCTWLPGYVTSEKLKYCQLDKKRSKWQHFY